MAVLQADANVAVYGLPLKAKLTAASEVLQGQPHRVGRLADFVTIVSPSAANTLRMREGKRIRFKAVSSASSSVGSSICYDRTLTQPASGSTAGSRCVAPTTVVCESTVWSKNRLNQMASGATKQCCLCISYLRIDACLNLESRLLEP